MLIGLAKWFDAERGFGVVGTPNGEEFFLHINNFTTKPDKILKGTPIVFSPKNDKVKNRSSTENSRLVGKPEDWKIIFRHLGNSDNVKIEVEVTKRGRRGNPYRQKEIQSFSLIRLSLKYFFKDKNEEEISDFITDYFDKELETKQFISYCEVIENSIQNNFSSDASSAILNKVFSHFGKYFNEDILFNVWKQKKFKFISFNEIKDYEIPESLLKANILEVGKLELTRILNFSFGLEFCTHYLDDKFCNIENLASSEIKELYQFIEFEKETEKEKRKNQLDILYAQKLEFELTENARKLDSIKNSEDLNSYSLLLALIPNELNDNLRNKITKAIHKIIDQKCSNEFKPELWIKGIIENVPFELVSKYFLDKDTKNEKRISILAKLQIDSQFELLKKHSVQYTFEHGFVLIEELVKKENSFSYHFNLLEVLFDSQFWKDKKCNNLIELFTNYVNTESDDEQKLQLFLKGYIKNVPSNIVLKKVHQIEKEDFKKLFKNLSENKSFVKDILIEKITLENKTSLSWLYDFAIEFLDKKNFKLFDTKVFDTIEHSEYFKFWEIGKAKTFPQKQIEELLNDKFENYAAINKWIQNNATTIKEISEFLLRFLHKQVLVTDRIIFHKQLNHIKCLLQLDELHLEHIKQIQNDFYNIILWSLDKVDILDFELLKNKFIYFSPNEQVRIIKKLFFIKVNGQFDFTIEMLNDLTRFDLDLYKTNLEFNPEIPIDISTDIVIKALLSYQQNKRFFVESELLTIILNDLKYDKTRRFKFSNYFEDCLGRQIAKFDWSRNGEISKVKFGHNKFYFAISFPTGETKRANSRWGSREYYSPNPNFENLKEAVKKIPGVKWNPNETHWGVPSQYETEVLSFAKEKRFFLDFEGNNYANNIHLANFKREDIPIGILFCEGRLANKKDEIFKREFYWCKGDKCYERCEAIHQTEQWENYTLLDFLEILELNTDSEDNFGNIVTKGKYYEFVGFINRFNRLLQHLYCNECNEILHPAEHGWFTVNNVIRFKCVNTNCNEKNKEVYLNHCLNGKCQSVIDNRISNRCPNDVFICKDCGSCCSHAFFGRRIQSININDFLDNPKKLWAYNETKRKYDNLLGHLEKGEYFCYKCESELKEISKEIFYCSKCNVKYDTTEYKFKRPHAHLRNKSATSGETGSNEETNNDDFDLPF